MQWQEETLRFRQGHFEEVYHRSQSQAVVGTGGRILGGLMDRVEQPLMETLIRAVHEPERTEFGSVLPNPGRAGLCPRCGVSHEALDFFNALVLALFETLMEGSEFKALLSRLGYSHGNQ